MIATITLTAITALTITTFTTAVHMSVIGDKRQITRNDQDSKCPGSKRCSSSPVVERLIISGLLLE